MDINTMSTQQWIELDDEVSNSGKRKGRMSEIVTPSSTVTSSLSGSDFDNTEEKNSGTSSGKISNRSAREQSGTYTSKSDRNLSKKSSSIFG